MGMRPAAVAHSLHVGFYNKAETLAVETAVKCIVVHPICGADLKDEAEIRGPAAADPVPDRTRVKHHVQPFVFPGHGKKGIIGDPIPMETDLKSTGFLIRFQGNMGLSLPQGQREGAQMPGVSPPAHRRSRSSRPESWAVPLCAERRTNGTDRTCDGRDSPWSGTAWGCMAE